MSIESEQDLRGLKAIGRIVAQVLSTMRKAVRPGITTTELDAIAADKFIRHGALSSPKAVYGFPGETCISVNDEVVHGVPGERKLNAGDIVKLDVTAQKNGYVADACISVAVEPADAASLRLIKCAEHAFDEAMKTASAGHRINEIGAAVERTVRGEGFSVVRELCGHGVGRTIHEEPLVPNYYHPSANRRLSEGLVITIEPIITAGTDAVHTSSDGWTIRTNDHARSAHFEHTLVITNGSPLVLTA
jgi:methionyl aminopeptidase